MSLLNDIFHPVEYLSGTLDASQVDVNGAGPTGNMTAPPPASSTSWSGWFSSVAEGAGSTTGSALAGILTPLLPIIIILVIVIIFAKTFAEKI